MNTPTDFDCIMELSPIGAPAQRLLLMFLGARRSAAVGEDEVEPIMITDCPLEPGLDFDRVAAMADDWEYLLVARLTRPDGGMPSAGEADVWLQQMATRVLEGQDLSDYLGFDRSGRSIGG